MAFEEINVLADSWIRPRMAERPRIFHDRVQGTLGEILGRNHAPSASTYAAVEKVMFEELELRGEMVFTGYRRAMESCNCQLHPEIHRDLERVLDSWLIGEASQIWGETHYVREACGTTHLGLQPDFRWPTFNKVSSEFNLLCTKLRKENTMNERQGAVTQIFHAPVASVQTGAGSSATVIQWNGEAKNGVLDALKALEAEVLKLARPEHQELRAVMSETKSELSQPKPNTLKVGGFLGIIGKVVSLIAEIKPAYDNLKLAAVNIGIHLP